MPVQGGVGRTGDESFTEKEIYIPHRREEAVIEKAVRTTEEIRVGKSRETDPRDVSETIRREDVEIEKPGGADESRRNR